MKKRIIGIDVARALAIFGMIIVNFKVVLGQVGEGWIKWAADLFDGKAAATFVVLAGIGLALMTNSAIRDQDHAKLQRSRTRIAKRALFLFVVGLSYIWIWPADILHFYGVYMILILLIINRPPRQLLIGTVIFIFIFPLLTFLLDYESDWNFDTLEYADFWTFKGFFKNLFFNGFHPVIPWVSFMLFGLWYGRQDLRDHKFLKSSLRISLIVFVAIQLLSFGLIQLLSDGDPNAINELTQLIGTSPVPPMPIYMISGISISVVIISACILLAERYENSPVIRLLNKTGQLALTFYVAHVMIGMGMVEVFSPLKYGEHSIQFSVIYALVFSWLCVLFAAVWLRFKKSGPLEWIMRKLTD